jgi:NADPH-dependent ferric siderophore reductase
LGPSPGPGRSDPAPLLAALKGVRLPPRRGFVWIAAEASEARALRDDVTGPIGHPKAWVKASGYWVKGQADAHVKLED